MKRWRDCVVTPELPLSGTLAAIDRSAIQLAIVLDPHGRLLGLVSDGDVRRALLRGVQLGAPTAEVMNRRVTTAPVSSDSESLLSIMRRRGIHQIPLVDAEQRVVGIVTLDALTGIAKRDNWVVLMAGGLGSRLGPLTAKCPKPMLKVGGKPILESIIESFVEQGFRNFFLAINYLGDVIRDHFGDGSDHGVRVEYLCEDKRMGTAGALSLLPRTPEEPLVVMNGDLLTKARFDEMLQFHEEQGASATMAVREYDFEVPYGVVRVDGERITGIEEKPVQSFYVNAGIYVLSPETLGCIPPDAFFDMPALFEKVISGGGTTAAYPLREYWLDVGRAEELRRAEEEWHAGGQ